MISALISTLWPYLLGGLAALAGAAGLYLKGRGDGAARAETGSLKKTIAAKDEQLEMHREATKAERDAAALSEAKAREEAMKWARR